MTTQGATPSEAILTIMVEGDSRRFIIAADGLVTIGRASSCQVQIQHSSVSREHCAAIFTDGKILINDLYSTHGINFKGKRVERCTLNQGDSCLLGNATLTFESSNQLSKPRSFPPIDYTDDISNQSTLTGFELRKEQPPAASKAESAPEATDNAKPSSNDRDTNRQIAGYRLLNKIGEGGFGSVYRAHQIQLNRDVALKILKPPSGNEDQSGRVEAFLREARVAAGLSDPHLVRVYDVGTSDGEYFLSMELIEGGSLAQKIKRDGPMNWQSVMRLIRDISLALRAAHEAKLVHRDVKPGNILLTNSGQAKLTDLGLAASDIHAGTVAFMAPEQLRRNAFDHRADIYALGCTAYAALTGSPPFTGDKQSIIQAQVKKSPPPLNEGKTQLPWHLNQLIIESMLAKDPANRPQSANDIIERIDKMILPSNAEPLAQDDQGDDYPSVAPKMLGRPIRTPSNSASSQKNFLARLAADTIIFSIISIALLALLLTLKAIWPGADIYRLIGK
jgi:serine/threonine protein kinase/pSer/pThr/pTyr-binding forkhead associated (FHA) protein